MAFQRQRSFRLDLEEWSLKAILRAEAALDEIGARMIEHVWTAYDRPTTGRGFTNRTFALRRSIKAEVVRTDSKVTLSMTADTDYASYVELIKNGKYAYLLPTLIDMIPAAEEILRTRLAEPDARGARGAKGRARIAELLAKGRAMERGGL